MSHLGLSMSQVLERIRGNLPHILDLTKDSIKEQLLAIPDLRVSKRDYDCDCDRVAGWILSRLWEESGVSLAQRLAHHAPQQPPSSWRPSPPPHPPAQSPWFPPSRPSWVPPSRPSRPQTAEHPQTRFPYQPTYQPPYQSRSRPPYHDPYQPEPPYHDPHRPEPPYQPACRPRPPYQPRPPYHDPYQPEPPYQPYPQTAAPSRPPTVPYPQTLSSWMPAYPSFLISIPASKASASAFLLWEYAPLRSASPSAAARQPPYQLPFDGPSRRRRSPVDDDRSTAHGLSRQRRSSIDDDRSHRRHPRIDEGRSRQQRSPVDEDGWRRRPSRVNDDRPADHSRSRKRHPSVDDDRSRKLRRPVNGDRSRQCRSFINEDRPADHGRFPDIRQPVQKREPKPKLEPSSEPQHNTPVDDGRILKSELVKSES